MKIKAYRINGQLVIDEQDLHNFIDENMGDGFTLKVKIKALKNAINNINKFVSIDPELTMPFSSINSEIPVKENYELIVELRTFL